MNEASPARIRKDQYEISRNREDDTYLLLLPQCKKTNARDLHDFESDSRNITLGLAATAEARDKNLIVLVDKVQATIVLTTRTRKRVKLQANQRKTEETHRHESSDLLAVFNKLHTNTFADGRVGLLRLNADLL